MTVKEFIDNLGYRCKNCDYKHVDKNDKPCIGCAFNITDMHKTIFEQTHDVNKNVYYKDDHIYERLSNQGLLNLLKYHISPYEKDELFIVTSCKDGKKYYVGYDGISDFYFLEEKGD